jgi:hypothetical protein
MKLGRLRNVSYVCATVIATRMLALSEDAVAASNCAP